METISDLRAICQKRESAIYKMNWFDRNVLRRLSIYLTRASIRRGLTANQITCLDFIFVLMVGLYFLSPHPLSWFGGLVWFLLYMLFDCMDGEVARYYMSKGKDKRPLGSGAMIGGVVDWFVWAYMFACMSFGVYLATGNVAIFAFGFLAIIARYIYQDMGLMPYPILHEKGLLANIVDKTEVKESKLALLGRLCFGAQGFMVAMVIVIALDSFIPLFGVGEHTLKGGFRFVMDARFVYLALFGLAALCGVALKLRDAYKHGARIQRI